MPDVFISYSRRDYKFAKNLTDALKHSAYDVWIDLENIEYAEDWWKKIQAGIDSADNFIFILTPDSAESSVCYDEIDHAVKSGKRIIPIAHINLTDQAKIDKLHPAISQHNWLPFQKSDNFETGMQLLIKTIETDLWHVKLHTRFLVRARDWEIGEKNPSFLFRGDEIDSAERWLEEADKHHKLPEPIPLHREYIIASRQLDLAEKRRLRTLQMTSMVAAIIGTSAIILTFIAFLSANNAQVQRDIAFVAGTEAAYDATVFALRQEFVSTLSSGGAVIAMSKLETMPDAFVATVTANAELLAFEPEIRDFSGVEMVLVPASCFWMGSISFEYEQPIHEICFDEAFWIDRYEVSNEQFERFQGVASNAPYWSDPKQARTSITWFEARDFCELREARLPTEAEWEYAARGPDSLAYPWGNEFVPDYVVYSGNSENIAPIVGSKPDGASWVGALDMSGSVWEWTSTIFDQNDFPYPYNPDDGREDLERIGVSRVIRGSSFLGGYFDYGVVDQVFLGLDLRGAWRLQGIVDFAGVDDGFRCALSE